MFDFALKISIIIAEPIHEEKIGRKEEMWIQILLNSWIVYMLSIKVDTSGKVVYFYCVVSFLFVLFLLINSIIFLFVVVTKYWANKNTYKMFVGYRHNIQRIAHVTLLRK